MKFVLTGINPVNRPDLERKLVVSEDIISLTIDRPDTAGGYHYNSVLRIKRHNDSYQVTADRVFEPYPNGHQVLYRIGGATHTLVIRTLEYAPTTLITKIVDHKTKDEIMGPIFTLDKQCVPTWRALVALMISETDLDVLARAAKTITRNSYSCYGMTPTALALRLTTPPYT